MIEHQLQKCSLACGSLTRILFPPSSKLLNVAPIESRPFIRDILFWTKYTVRRDLRCRNASGTACKRLKDRSKTLWSMNKNVGNYEEETHESCDKLFNASPTVLTLLSYKSNSSNFVSRPKVSGSRKETKFWRKQSFLRWPANRSNRRFFRFPMREWTSSNSWEA